MPFRGKDGRFSPSINLTYQDLRREIRRIPGDHWLSPPGFTQYKPWRIHIANYPFLAGLFPPDARPTVKRALWAYEHGYVPTRLRSLCKVKGCLNPHHHEEIKVNPEDVYRVFFQQAYGAAEGGTPLRVEFSTEGEATRYRQKLNAFRRRGLDDLSLPSSWSHLSLRILPPTETSNSIWTLTAELPSEDLESALKKALGVGSLETLADEPSALDLIKGDLNK